MPFLNSMKSAIKFIILFAIAPLSVALVFVIVGQYLMDTITPVYGHIGMVIGSVFGGVGMLAFVVCIRISEIITDTEVMPRCLF